jgi:hypothetical protein
MTNYVFPYTFTAIDGINFGELEQIPIPHFYDLSIFYDNDNYVEGRCSMWNVTDYTLTVDTWLKEESVKILRQHMVPGAVGELYQILGRPTYYDKTWESKNTLILKPIPTSQRSRFSNLHLMRSDTVIYPKTFTEHPIETTDWIEVKIDAYVSSNAN